MDMLCKQIPRGGFGFTEAGELIDSVMPTVPQCAVAELNAVHRDDRKLRGLAAILRQIEQGRDQLAPGQVASPAKNDEYNWVETVGGFHRFHDCSHSV